MVLRGRLLFINMQNRFNAIPRFLFLMKLVFENDNGYLRIYQLTGLVI